MTMQRRPNNPIEQRKQAVRKYTRNAALSVGGGVVGGLALGLLFTSWTWLILGLVVAVAVRRPASRDAMRGSSSSSRWSRCLPAPQKNS